MAAAAQTATRAVEPSAPEAQEGASSGGASAPPGRPPRQAVLTAAERQRLPRLQIGGAMYSEERGSRMLVINDQLLREGDRAAAGVVLERIGPRSAQFSFEGKRFELPY